MLTCVLTNVRTTHPVLPELDLIVDMITELRWQRKPNIMLYGDNDIERSQLMVSGSRVLQTTATCCCSVRASVGEQRHLAPFGRVCTAICGRVKWVLTLVTHVKLSTEFNLGLITCCPDLRLLGGSIHRCRCLRLR